MKYHRIPLAWCVEHEEEVTPYQALKRRTNHLTESLTFQCLECRGSLLLTQQRRGFLNHPLFIRRARENHDSCLYAIYRTRLTESMKLRLEFEDTLALLASTVKKLEKNLHALEITQSYLREDISSGEENARLYDYILDIDLAPSKQTFAILEKTLQEVEGDYKRKSYARST